MEAKGQRSEERERDERRGGERGERGEERNREGTGAEARRKSTGPTTAVRIVATERTGIARSRYGDLASGNGPGRIEAGGRTN